MNKTVPFRKEFGLNISSKAIAQNIFTSIKTELKKNPVTLDLEGVESITTYCASLIFGQLYYELGEEGFYTNIQILNASDPIKIIIHEGILGFLEKQKQ